MWRASWLGLSEQRRERPSSRRAVESCRTVIWAESLALALLDQVRTGAWRWDLFRVQGRSRICEDFPCHAGTSPLVPRDPPCNSGSACKPSQLKVPLARPATKSARRASTTLRKSRYKRMRGRATNTVKAPACSGSRTPSAAVTTRWRPGLCVSSKMRAKDRNAIASGAVCERGYAERTRGTARGRD